MKIFWCREDSAYLEHYLITNIAKAGQLFDFRNILMIFMQDVNSMSRI